MILPLTMSCTTINTRVKNECPILEEIGYFIIQDDDILTLESKRYLVALNRVIKDCKDEY